MSMLPNSFAFIPKKILVLIGLSVLAIYGLYYYLHPPFLRILLGRSYYQFEVAMTPEEITRGLSYRSNLKSNSGMLFLFPDKLPRTFWMHEMRFPLDIIWVKDKKIIGIEQNVPYPQNGEKPQTVNSPDSVNVVLEIPAGSAKRDNIQIGDEIMYKTN